MEVLKDDIRGEATLLKYLSRKEKYVIARPLTLSIPYDDGMFIHVKCGEILDFTYIPFCVRHMFTNKGRYPRIGVFYSWLCHKKVRYHMMGNDEVSFYIERDEIDKALYHSLRNAGINFLKARLIYLIFRINSLMQE